MGDGQIFQVARAPQVPVVGRDETFPVGRIFCVGRNYEAHAAEMGNVIDREAPFYFTKSAQTICATGAEVAYPPGTQDFHYEMEFVVAIGAPAFRVDVDDAINAVFGYACGLDMTRRDLQAAGKAGRRPWDLGKDFENSAVIAPITPIDTFGDVGVQTIRLRQNGEMRQDADLSLMVWSVPEIIAHLSKFYHLVPGDLIYTGTPAGVGPVVAGDVLHGEITGLTPIEHRIGAPE